MLILRNMLKCSIQNNVIVARFVPNHPTNDVAHIDVSVSSFKLTDNVKKAYYITSIPFLKTFKTVIEAVALRWLKKAIILKYLCNQRDPSLAHGLSTMFFQ